MAIDFDFLRHRLGLTSSGEGSGRGAGASLALLRERLRRAEGELSSARAAMRSGADAAGVERAGLFSDTRFVPRSTADNWHESGVAAGRREVIDAMIESRDGDPDEVRAGIRARLKTQRVAMKAEDERWRASGIDAAFAEKNYARALAIFRKLYPESDDPRKATAARVLAAGQRARMSADAAGEVPEPEKGSFAAQVIAAGKKARRPTGSDDE